MSNLSRRCVPCRQDTPKLTAEAVRAMMPSIPGWSLSADGNSISRRLRLKNFDQAFTAVTAVAAIAEREDHHPDISFGWGYAAFTLTTHAIGGLHGNDFIVAQLIDDAIAAEVTVPKG